jgi:hypothetical protein
MPHVADVSLRVNREERQVLHVELSDGDHEILTDFLWRHRFEANGLDGLLARHRGSKRTVLTPALQARILAWTRRAPPHGATHWSTRSLGRRLGVQHTIVVRAWHEAGLQPHRLGRYMRSTDPDFETKAADVIGLYLDPPQHAVVFCVDEKTAIQALDRINPILPLSPGRAERHGFEYYRHDTLSLYAALMRYIKQYNKTAKPVRWAYVDPTRRIA